MTQEKDLATEKEIAKFAKGVVEGTIPINLGALAFGETVTVSLGDKLDPKNIMAVDFFRFTPGQLIAMIGRTLLNAEMTSMVSGKAPKASGERIEANEAEIAKLKAQCDGNYDAAAKWKAEYDDIEKRFQAVIAENKALRAKNPGAAAVLDDAGAKIADASNAVANREAVIEGLKAEVAELTKMVNQKKIGNAVDMILAAKAKSDTASVDTVRAMLIDDMRKSIQYSAMHVARNNAMGSIYCKGRFEGLVAIAGAILESEAVDAFAAEIMTEGMDQIAQKIRNRQDRYPEGPGGPASV